MFRFDRMTDETANLILEQLRIIRGDIKDVRDRVDHVDIQVQGLSYLVTTAIGALATRPALSQAAYPTQAIKFIIPAIFVASANCCWSPGAVTVARGSILSVSGCVKLFPSTVSLTV